MSIRPEPIIGRHHRRYMMYHNIFSKNNVGIVLGTHHAILCETANMLDTGVEGINIDKKLKYCLDLLQPSPTHTAEELDIADGIRRSIYYVISKVYKQNEDLAKEVLTRMSGCLTTMSDGKWNSSIWNAVLKAEGEEDILSLFMEYANYRLKTNGNPVRDAVYANRLGLADLLIQKGFKPVDKINMFQIANMINWDPNRLRYLLANKCTIEASDKETETLKLIMREIRLKETEESL